MTGTVAQLMDASVQELDLREALANLLVGKGKPSEIRDLDRPIIITPYNRGYDHPGGVVLAIEGSPPRALVMAITEFGKQAAHIIVIRQPFRAGPVLELDRNTPFRWGPTSGKRKTYEAVVAFLESIGAF